MTVRSSANLAGDPVRMCVNNRPWCLHAGAFRHLLILGELSTCYSPAADVQE